MNKYKKIQINKHNNYNTNKSLIHRNINHKIKQNNNNNKINKS